MRTLSRLRRRKFRFRFHRKKRGARVSGSARLATMGEALFFGACLLLGAVTLGLIVFWYVLPQWRVNRYFLETTCQVLAEPSVEKREEMETTLYQPTIRYEYTVDHMRYVGDRYDLLGTRYAERDKAEAVSAAFTIDETYPCWYDPLEPGTAVLSRGSLLAYWALLLPVAFLAIGVGGLGYTVWQFSASRERRAAIVQKATGKELFEDASEAGKFPSIPGDADITNSPGTTLAFRLPITSRAGWHLFAMTLACLIWNVTVAFFLFLAIRKFVTGDADLVFLVAMVPFFASGIWLFVNLGRQFWRSSGIGTTRIEISDHPLRPGMEYDLFIAQTGKMHLKNLDVTLLCEEEATYRQGTNTITDTEAVFCEQVFSQSEIIMEPSQPYQEHCRLRIPASGMHSFQGLNNSISWKLSVYACVARRPDHTRHFSVVVVPAVSEGAQA